jgi:hypothetical protein
MNIFTILIQINPSNIILTSYINDVMWVFNLLQIMHCKRRGKELDFFLDFNLQFIYLNYSNICYL